MSNESNPNKPDRLDNYLVMAQIKLFNTDEVGKLEYLVQNMEDKSSKRSVCFSCLEFKRYVPEELNLYMDLITKLEHDWAKDGFSMAATQIINSETDKNYILSFVKRLDQYLDSINTVIGKKETSGDKGRLARRLASMIKDRPIDFEDYLKKCLET